MSDLDLSDLTFFGFPAGQPIFGGSLSGDASGGGSRYWKFLTPEQQHRLEKIRGARMLFSGLHREYFLDERRTQFSFPNSLIGGIYGESVRQLYETHNVLGLISRKGADLLFGDEPILRVSAPAQAAGGEAYTAVQEQLQRDFLADLIQRCDLPALLHQKAEDASCDGECFLESLTRDGEVWVADVPGEEIFPVGKPGPDRQYAAYDRYTVCRQPAADPNAPPIDLLLITHYRVGSIDRECWQLHQGDKSRRLPIDAWPLQPGESPLAESVSTGLTLNTITYVPNQLRHGKAVNDYSGAAEHLQDALNAKMSQIAWILAKHAQPKLSRHSRHAQPDGNSAADYSVEYNDDQADASKYITWDGQLQWAIKDRDFTLEQLLVATESSPVLLGLNLGGQSHASAYKSFRLMAANAIAKAARKANYFKAGLRRALDVCCRLANTLPQYRFEIYPISVQLRDGIPLDGLEEAQRQSVLRAAGLLSVRRGIHEQIPEPAEAEAEIAEIAAEDAARQPVINFAPPAGPHGGAVGGPAGADAGAEQEEADHVAADDPAEVAA